MSDASRSAADAEAADHGPGWSPPERLEERLKRLLLPPGLHIRGLHLRELRKGERELRLIPALADPTRAAVDVGANRGVYAYALARLGCRVHAFEPNPKMFRVLESWGRGRIGVHPTALGDRSGRARLHVPKGRIGYSNQGASLSTVKSAGQAGGLVDVEVARLDDLEIADVGFLKIDVEGFELQVLRGAEATLRRDRPTLLVEIEEKYAKRDLAEMVAEVCGYGYSAFALPRGVLTPFARLDLAAHHRDPQRPGDYVFNFLFFPLD